MSTHDFRISHVRRYVPGYIVHATEYDSRSSREFKEPVVIVLLLLTFTLRNDEVRSRTFVG